MKKIFFCYTLKDGVIKKEFLYNLQTNIKKIGLDCYIDLLDNSYHLKKFQLKLLEELNFCDIICVIRTPEVMNSKWVRIEIEEAKKSNKPIFYIDYDNITEFFLNKEKLFIL